MADDFEKAVYFSFAQPGSAPADVAAQATAALEAARRDPSIWALCLTHLQSSAYAEVRFWCLQTLHGLVGERYGELAPEQRDALKQTLVGAALGGDGLAPFLRNKLAQTLVAIARQEFPGTWPTFFQDLIATLPSGPLAADLFCRHVHEVLTAVDEDIVSLEVPRSATEARASMAFKDGMRDLSLADIATAWTGLLAARHASDPEGSAALLRALGRYVPWVDIGLVANDAFVPLLFTVLASPDAGLRGAAADVLCEIVGKRMEAEPKLALIQQLGVVPVCARWAEGMPGCGGGRGEEGEDGGGGGGGGDDDDELAGKYARLLSTLASEILEALKKIENAVLSLAAVGLAVDADAGREAGASTRGAAALLDALFPALLRALRRGEDDVAGACLPFLLAYVNWVKATARRKGGVAGVEGGRHLPVILEALAECARYPHDSAVQAVQPAGLVARGAAEEEEAAMGERRQDLFTLFKNCAKLDPGAGLGLVRAMLGAALSDPASPWQEVELAISLLYQLGESPSDADLKPGTGALAELALGMMRADHPSAAHRLVALATLEASVRYARVLAAPAAASVLPGVLGGFLGVRGLGHGDPGVQRRAAYLLCRLTKGLRGQLRPAAPGVLARLAPHLAAIAASPAAEAAGTKAVPGRGVGGVALTAVDDRLYAFEAAGLLLGQEDMDAGEQAAWLAAVLQPLTRQIEEALGSGDGLPPVTGPITPALLVQQALEGITRVAKGFSLRLCMELRPALGMEFTRALRGAAQVPRRLPGHRALRARLLSFLHRMVETLGPASLPFMPEVLQALVRPGADACELTDALTLLNQLMSRFKEDLAPLVREVLPVLLTRVHDVLGSDWDWSGSAIPGSPPAAADEVAREREELQRAYFAFLLCIASTGLGRQLLAAGPPTLDNALGALLQTLHRLLASWMELGEDAGSAITTFAVDKARLFAGQVCLQAMLTGPSRLDPRDASSIGLLAEAAAGLLMVHGRAQEELTSSLSSGLVMRLGWPAAAGQQLLQLIADGNSKALRDFLREALQQQPPQEPAKH